MSRGIHEILLTITHPSPGSWCVSCEEPYGMVVSSDRQLAIATIQNKVLRALHGKYAEVRFEARTLPNPPAVKDTTKGEP